MAAIAETLGAILEEVQGLRGLRGLVKQIAKGGGAGGGGGLGDLMKDIPGAEKALRAVFQASISDALEKAMKAQQKAVEEFFSKGAIAGISKVAGRIGKEFERAINAGVSAMRSPKAVLEKITTGLFKGVSKVADHAVKKMKKAGEQMQMKGAKKGGAIGGMQKGLGKFMRLMGPALSMIGVFASSIASLVGLLFDAESQAKNLNKSIVEGGIAGGDLASNFYDVRDALDGVRSSATDFFNNYDWGTVAKDQIEIIGAFNEAGYTIKEMTKDTTDAASAMKDYADVTRVALTYSKLLGISAREMATQQAEYMESLGGSLQFVEQQFNAVFKTAQLSGFGVKRFYSMVQQATSGMSMYNVRLDEAAGLLIRLGKILGSRVAGDFLQQLNKGFVDESMTDRFKRVMTTGSDTMQEIFANSADDIAMAFGQKLSALPAETASGVNDVLASAQIGVDVSTEKGRSDLVNQLSKMDPKESASLLAEIRAVDEDTARELGKLIDVSQGTTGKMGDMANAMGSLDMGGTLAAKLAQANAVIGKPLHEMSAMEQAAFENITGISGEQREILKKVSQGMYGNYDVLQKSQEEIKELAAAGKDDEIAALQKKQLETYGAFVKVMDDGTTQMVTATMDETGQIVEGTEKSIENIGEYIQSQGDAIAQASEVGLDKNTALAKTIASNTTDLATIMEMGVQAVLEQIYDVILSIWSWMGGDVVSRETRSTKMDAKKDEISALRDTGKDLKEQIIAQKQAVEEASGEDKVKAEEQLALLEDQAKQNEVAIKMGEEQLNEMAGAMTGDEWDAATKDSGARLSKVLKEVYGDEAGNRIVQDVLSSVRTQAETAGDRSGVLPSEEVINVMQNKALEWTAKQVGEGDMSIQEVKASATSASQLASFSQAAGWDPRADENVGTVEGFFKETVGMQGDSKALRREANLGENALEMKDALQDLAKEGVAFFQYSRKKGKGDLGISYGLGEDTAFGLEKAAAGVGIVSQDYEKSYVQGMDVEDLMVHLSAKGQEAFMEAGGVEAGDSAFAAAESAIQSEMYAMRAELERMNSEAAEQGSTEKEWAQQNAGAYQQLSDAKSLEEKMYSALPENQEKMQETIDGMLTQEGFEAAIAEEQKAEEKRMKDLTKEEKKQREEHAKDLAKYIDEDAKARELSQMIAAAYGWDPQQGFSAPSSVSSAIHSGDPEQMAQAAMASMTQAQKTMTPESFETFQRRFGGLTMQDFVMRPGQSPVAFSSEDTLIGMKPGGPLDKLSGSSGGGVVNITINGDTATVYRTVKKVFQEAGMIQR